MANNKRETTYLCKQFFLKEVYCNNYTFFSLGDIVNKVTLQFTVPKYSPLNLHNTHQFIKKMQGTTAAPESERRGGTQITHTTAVKMALNTDAQTNCNQCLLDASHTVCAYIGQNTNTIGELLYFH